MRKLWLVMLAVVALSAFAVGASAAQANTVTPLCNLGSCNAAWFNAAVNLTWSFDVPPDGPDPATTGCDTPTINETAGQTVTCTANWSTGTTPVSQDVTVHVDTSDPTVTGATANQTPNALGWFNHLPLTFDFTGNDVGPSGLLSCSPGVAYGGGDNANASVSGTCTDNAGNSPPLVGHSFKFDATPPVVTGAIPSRPADSNGWFNHAVSFAFTGNDATSGLGPCTTTAPYTGPNSATATVSGSCADNASNVTSGSATFKYDDAAPKVTDMNTSRSPDQNGWFNHAVTLSFKGTDATSGIGSCPDQTFSGPSNGRVTITGTCADKAGNVGSATFSLPFDNTPPDAVGVKVARGNHRVRLDWTKPKDAANVKVERAPKSNPKASKVIYSGDRDTLVDKHLKNGKAYTYTLIDTDPAGNDTSTGAISVIPTGLSLRPLPGAAVNAAPRLTWKKDKRAKYYNLQLYVGNTKVLSTWPHGSAYQVKNGWIYQGHAYSLAPGTYTWYVWPGLGSRKRNHYGHIIGKSTFTLQP
ncbi:MAG TPA: hypothetical protein VGI67_06080 [Thermoleophilaceae bacterium]